MKKILCFALAFIMLGAMFPASAAAARLTVTTPAKPVSRDESFAVAVEIAGNPGIASMQFTLAYDETEMECTEISFGAALHGMNVEANPKASDGAMIAAASPNAGNGGGTVAVFRFKALKNVYNFNVSLENAELTDEKGENVRFSVERKTTLSSLAEILALLALTAQEQPDEEPEFVPGEVLSEPQPVAEPAPDGKFNDIADHPARAYIEQAAERGIFEGYPDGSFRPDAVISRAEFVTVLWRMMGSPEPGEMSGFEDVPDEAYCAKAVAWAKETGCVNGVSETRFDPDGIIQRQAAMKILFYLNGGQRGGEVLLSAVYESQFDGVADWAKNAVWWGVYNELISVENGLRPADGATRAELAETLVKYFEKFGGAA